MTMKGFHPGLSAGRGLRIRVLAVIVAVAVIGGGLWLYHSLTRVPPAPSDILASGFIEATNVSIAPEVNGRIVSIAADEGSVVEAGVILIKLDDSLQTAQFRQAEASVRLAQSVREQALAFRNQASVYTDGAKKAWADAVDVQQNPLELESKIIAAHGQLSLAESNLSRAREQGTEWDRRIAELQRDIAEEVLQNLEDIRDNPQAINAAVDQSYAAYQTALAALDVADRAVGVATGQVEQAQASLDVIKVQLARTVLTSPTSGVVSARNAEVGEFVQSGVPILTISQLEEVTLTVWVPESRIGQVKLGQQAVVSVDSYPGQYFLGRVSYISPQAEFTPKNVQVKEERGKTVFAVRIRLPNQEQKLKPGMPADARIVVTGGTQ